MSGIVFSHLVLQQIVKTANPAPELADHPQAAALGALGSLVLRYVTPKDPALYDPEAASTILSSGTPAEKLDLQDKLLMIAYGSIIKKVQPAIKTLETLIPLLQQMRDAAQAEDTDKLKTQGDQFNALDLSLLGSGGGGIEGAVAELKTFVIDKVSVAYRPLLQTSMTGPAPIANLVKLPETWRRYERLRWERTGQFVQRLMSKVPGAAAGVQPAVRAYALGFRSHWATGATSSSFLNNIIRGPYRSHWWRSLLVQNAVDGWAHGFFNLSRIGGLVPTMSGSEPVPKYADWATLQNATLDKVFDVGTGRIGHFAFDDLLAGTPGTSAELTAIAAAFTSAWNDVYPPASNPLLTQLNPPNLGPFQDSDFLAACNGLRSVMFLLTGDHPLISFWMATIAPPKKLFPPPPIGGPGGGGAVPSFPSYSPSAAGIILGILAIIALLLGWWIVAAVLAVVTIIVEIINAVNVGDDVTEKLEELDSNLFHIQIMIQQVSLAFQDALWTAGLGFPRADQLGTVGPSGTTQHLTDRSAAAYGDPTSVHLFTSSVPRVNRYPLRTNETPPPDGQFDRSPDYSGAAGQEGGTGPAADWPERGFFPDVALAGRGSTWALNGGGAIATPVPFPFRPQTAAPDSPPVFFGNSVANGVEAINQPDTATFTDFNLDADRGYGWRCWEVRRTAPVPATGTVDAVAPT